MPTPKLLNHLFLLPKLVSVGKIASCFHKSNTGIIIDGPALTFLIFSGLRNSIQFPNQSSDYNLSYSCFLFEAPVGVCMSCHMADDNAEKMYNSFLLSALNKYKIFVQVITFLYA